MAPAAIFFWSISNAGEQEITTRRLEGENANLADYLESLHGHWPDILVDFRTLWNLLELQSRILLT